MFLTPTFNLDRRFSFMRIDDRDLMQLYLIVCAIVSYRI
jgi:hypothetical protein